MKITFGLPGRVAFKGWGKTVALLVLFTLPVTLVWGFAGQKSAYSLFQSPLQTSPVATPTPKPPPPTNTPLPPTNTPPPPKLTTPPAAAPAEETPVPPTSQTEPVGGPPSEPTATIPPSTGALTPTQRLTATQVLTATVPDLVPAPAQPTPFVPAQPQQSLEPPPSGAVVINEVKLIDTVVEFFAWGWMCVGVGLILAVLVVFPLLQVRGAHLRRSQKS